MPRAQSYMHNEYNKNTATTKITKRQKGQAEPVWPEANE